MYKLLFDLIIFLLLDTRPQSHQTKVDHQVLPQQFAREISLITENHLSFFIAV